MSIAGPFLSEGVWSQLLLIQIIPHNDYYGVFGGPTEETYNDYGRRDGYNDSEEKIDRGGF